MSHTIEEIDGMSLDCETNIAFILILPDRFTPVHECDFADPDSHMVMDFNLPSLQLNSEEWNYKTLF